MIWIDPLWAKTCFFIQACCRGSADERNSALWSRIVSSAAQHFPVFGVQRHGLSAHHSLFGTLLDKSSTYSPALCCQLYAVQPASVQVAGVNRVLSLKCALLRLLWLHVLWSSALRVVCRHAIRDRVIVPALGNFLLHCILQVLSLERACIQEVVRVLRRDWKRRQAAKGKKA